MHTHGVKAKRNFFYMHYNFLVGAPCNIKQVTIPNHNDFVTNFALFYTIILHLGVMSAMAICLNICESKHNVLYLLCTH